MIGRQRMADIRLRRLLQTPLQTCQMVYVGEYCSCAWNGWRSPLLGLEQSDTGEL